MHRDRHGLDAKTVQLASAEVAAVLEGDVPSNMDLLDTGCANIAMW